MAALIPGDSPQIKLVNEWNQGFRELNLDIIKKYLHKDFRRFVYPRSIGQAEQNKEEWLEFLAVVKNFATGIESTLHSFIEAPGKVIFHSTTEVKNSYGLNTIRESLFITHIVTDDDGSLKVKQFDEFADPIAYLEMRQAIAAVKGVR